MCDGGSRRFPQRSDAVGAEHLGLANPDRLVVEGGSDAASDQVLEPARGRDLAPAQPLAAIPGNRRGQRMVAERLNCRCNGEQFLLRHPIDGDDIGDARTPFGQGARLVEGHCTERAEFFQGRAALDQHAAAGRAGNA